MNVVIIILAVILAVVGFVGGRWFWQKMAESPNWEQIRRYVKIVGLCGAPGLFAIAILFVWMVTQPPELFRQCISCINIGSWFLFFYMLGYDVSILRPEPEKLKAPHGNQKTTLEFHIKWDLIKKELFACMIAIAPAVALLLFSRIDIQVFEIWVAGVVGFAMGLFFWEHLKEKVILTGTFKRQVVILSLLTTVAIGYIAGYGGYVGSSAANSESIQILLVSFMLFVECMAWYMLALCIVVFRAK